MKINVYFSNEHLRFLTFRHSIKKVEQTHKNNQKLLDERAFIRFYIITMYKMQFIFIL